MTTTGWSVRYRGTWVEALPHKLPPDDTHWPADWLSRGWHRVTAQHRCASRAHRRPSSHCGPTCWTLNLRSGQSYCSFNSHTNSNFALMKYILGAGGWTHSTKLYPKHQNLLSWHIGAFGRHYELLCMYFCKWNLCRVFMCECIKMLLRPVDCEYIDMQPNHILSVANIVENRYTWTELPDVERAFHSRQISGTKSKSRQHESEHGRWQ